jgi:3-deoxy-manno-octulosonate cytidylyltransferase (CMP-KDO synthetase)
MEAVQNKIDIAWFKECLNNKQLVSALKNIQLIISDVDGALTDAHVYVSPEGEGGRMFSTQDGFIVKYVQNTHIKLGLMSGKDNASTMQRAKKLGIPEEYCAVGLESKIAAVQHVQNKLNIDHTHTLMYGDDYLDANIKLQNLAAIYACPSNAPFYIQSIANVVIPRNGGDNAFRLLMDLLLYLNNKHFAQDLITKSL